MEFAAEYLNIRDRDLSRPLSEKQRVGVCILNVMGFFLSFIHPDNLLPSSLFSNNYAFRLNSSTNNYLRVDIFGHDNFLSQPCS